MKRTQAIGTYYKLKEKVHQIHYFWFIFQELNKDNNIKILRDIAPEYFQCSRDLFFHNVVLEIAKLMDKSTVCGETNLSLLKLIEELEKEKREIGLFKTKYESLFESFKKIEPYRHKVLAHNDYKSHIYRSFPKITIKDVSNTISLLRNCISSIEAIIKDSVNAVTFFDPVPASIDANNHFSELIKYLKISLNNKIDDAP